MTDDTVPASRPTFVVADYFLETAFEMRFQGLLRQAWRERSWHVIAALPGSGKSLGIADMTHQSNVYKDSRELLTSLCLPSALRRMGAQTWHWGRHSVPSSALCPRCPGISAVPGWYKPWPKRESNVSSSTMLRI